MSAEHICRANPPAQHVLQSKPIFVTCVQNTPCAADKTSQYVRQLLEPAFSSVPAAADIPALFQAALHRSGTLPFPVPDVFYQSQRMQDDVMRYYLAPVSQSDAVSFGSVIHSVLFKTFHEGGETTQAGLVFACFQPTCFYTIEAGLCANAVNALCALLLLLLHGALSTYSLGLLSC